MDEVREIYDSNKLLVRAMGYPSLQRSDGELEYDCSVWADEFCLLMNADLNSASSTLVVPGVGVSTYKNMGFLMNSDLVNCFHIATSDSCSRGNLNDGDFAANPSDFDSIEELASYIVSNNATNMNEVNVVAKIDSVVGLFVNKCINQNRSLSMMLLVQKCLKDLVGIEYPIYLYDTSIGSLDRFELDDKKKEELLSCLKTDVIFYWPEDFESPVRCSFNGDNKIL